MSDSREELINEYVASMHCISMIVEEAGYQIRKKAHVGGVFGYGGFVLASWWTVSGGLDRVDYFLCHASSMFVVAWGGNKETVLDSARMVLEKWLTAARLSSECSKHVAAVQALRDEKRRQHEEERAARQAEVRGKEQIRSIPRRRQQIFEESKGACHYCGTALTLDGKWHIEHKMPKALGGGNEPGNLVASCVSCNHKKRDTTDVEFKAKLARQKGTP